MADCGQQRSPDLVGLGEWSRLGRSLAEPDPVQDDRDLGCEGSGQALVLCLEESSAEGEDEPVSGGHIGLCLARAGARWSCAGEGSPLVLSLLEKCRGGEPEGLQDPLQHLLKGALAAEDAAGEVGQGAGLGGRSGCLPGAAGGQVDHRADQRGDQDEHQQRESVVGLADRERVQGRREVVVEQHGAEDGGDQGRRKAADKGHDDRDQQEEEHVADEVELVTEGNQGHGQQRREQEGKGIATQLAPPAETAATVGQARCPCRCAGG